MCAQDNPRRGTAMIRVRRPSGRLATFEAERVEISHGLVTVVGRWRDDRQRRRRAYTWSRQIVEIDWRNGVPLREAA